MAPDRRDRLPATKSYAARCCWRSWCWGGGRTAREEVEAGGAMVDQSPLCTHGVLAAEFGPDGRVDRETAGRAALHATVRPTEETFARMGSTTS